MKYWLFLSASTFLFSACGKNNSLPAEPVEKRNEYNATVHYYNESKHIVLEDTVYQSLITTIEKQDTMTVIVIHPSGQLDYSELQVKRRDTVTGLINYYSWYNHYAYSIQLTVDPSRHTIHFLSRRSNNSPSNSYNSFYEADGR